MDFPPLRDDKEGNTPYAFAQKIMGAYTPILQSKPLFGEE